MEGSGEFVPCQILPNQVLRGGCSQHLPLVVRFFHFNFIFFKLLLLSCIFPQNKNSNIFLFRLKKKKITASFSVSGKKSPAKQPQQQQRPVIQQQLQPQGRLRKTSRSENLASPSAEDLPSYMRSTSASTKKERSAVMLTPLGGARRPSANLGQAQSTSDLRQIAPDDDSSSEEDNSSLSSSRRRSNSHDRYAFCSLFAAVVDFKCFLWLVKITPKLCTLKFPFVFVVFLPFIVHCHQSSNPF